MKNNNINFKELFDYCSKILLEKKYNIENKLINDLTKNLKNKIKDALIDNKTNIIIYDDIYNPNIFNILNKLKNNLYPFNIIYRKKTFSENTFFDNLFNNELYILIIDWSNYYSYNKENKLVNLFNKYIEYKYKKIYINTNFYSINNNIDNNIDTDNSYDLIE